MLININTLRERINGVILNKGEQGHNIEGLENKLESINDSYDALIKFTESLHDLPIKNDWPYVEPNGIEEIRSESDPTRHLGSIKTIDFEESSNRVKAAFLGSICGCILGKPLEASLTGNEIKSALKAAEEWPMNDYVASKIKEYLPRVHESFNETAREYINYVAPDDDINYTIMGMLILEKFGLDFNHSDIEELWLHHLPIGTTFGPERTMLVKSGLESFNRWDLKSFLEKGGVGPRGQITEKESSKSFRILNDILNPGDELCGATIRADAYGYACPGNPEMAANLAWKDSSFTHNRTGIYGTMFVAAAIACAQIFTDRMKIFETALKYIPQRSRFHERVSACILDIKDSSNWEEGYKRINNKYGEYGHCRIYQEIGMLINTLKFAESVGNGICIQVSQGADTDSFGATAGSILGAYFGPGHLEDKWLKPFNDDIHSGMAWFFERSITKLANRMGQLPKLSLRATGKN